MAPVTLSMCAASPWSSTAALVPARVFASGAHWSKLALEGCARNASGN